MLARELRAELFEVGRTSKGNFFYLYLNILEIYNEKLLKFF